MLLRAGFKDVHSLEGGIEAWEGRMAEGAPEAGMAYFSPSTTPVEYAALAWALEDGSARFYREVSRQFKDIETRRLFSRLSHAEEHHKAALGDLYRRSSGAESAEGFPANVLGEDPYGDVMEGGISVTEALRWAKGRNPNELLELLISLETNSFDLYMRMARAVEDEQARHLFLVLSEEERKHVEVLTGIFEKRIA